MPKTAPRFSTYVSVRRLPMNGTLSPLCRFPKTKYFITWSIITRTAEITAVIIAAKITPPKYK